MLRHQVGVCSQAVAGAFDADHGGMVQQSVEQGSSHHRVAEQLAPFGKAAVGGEHHGAIFVSCADQLKEQAGTAGGYRQIADFVHDQQCGASVEAHLGGQPSATFGGGQRLDHHTVEVQRTKQGSIGGLDIVTRVASRPRPSPAMLLLRGTYHSPLQHSNRLAKHCASHNRHRENSIH